MTPVQHDTIMIINGPEDGTEFFVSRAPILVGTDPTCGVNIRLDANVQPVQAQLTPVGEGYRVRSNSNAPVYVNGKRAGGVRSRVLRPGDKLRVGHTLLALQCAPDGLASRSRGLVLESDLAWALRKGVRETAHLCVDVLVFAVRIPGRVLRRWKGTLIAGFVGGMIFWPPFRETVYAYGSAMLNIVRDVISQIFQ